jgi:hypothetical protein
MDATQATVAIMTAGGGVFLVALVQGLGKYLSGAAGRERARNSSLKQQRDEAWALVREERERADLSDARADVEAHNRRLTEEYASQLRRDCTEHGMSDRELRPWPVLKKPPPEPDQD